jgi:hypothetical protein
MRKLLLISIFFFTLNLLCSCHNNDTADSSGSGNTKQISTNVVDIPASAAGESAGKLPKMIFTDTNYDFGKIKEGDKVTHIFLYKNEGQGDLVISNAIASCGCTKPNFTKGVKHPGDTGTISVTFDSSNKSGKMVKLVTISCNCQPSRKYLTINANIQPLNN